MQQKSTTGSYIRKSKRLCDTAHT